MRNLKMVNDLPRKGERVSVQFDDETLLKRIEEMADVEERPLSRQLLLLVRAAIELIDEQNFHLVNGKLRKVSYEPLETESDT